MPEGEKHRERAADKRFDSSPPKGSHRSGIYGRSSAVKGISLPGPCPFDLGVAESYVQFMRGLRRYTIALLVAAVAVAVVASSATAEYRDHDPDDTATSFDIRSVSSNVLPNRHLLFRSTTTSSNGMRTRTSGCTSIAAQALPMTSCSRQVSDTTLRPATSIRGKASLARLASESVRAALLAQWLDGS